MTQCRICGNAEANTPHLVKEMMFGTCEVFEYFECGRCGCLQIARIPDDLPGHYPAGYDAHTALEGGGDSFKRFAKSRWLAHLQGRRNVLGLLQSLILREPFYFEWVKGQGLAPDDPILDVGCGTGNYLDKLWECGFSNLTGMDPFIRQDILLANGVRIRKCFLDEMTGQYALVMLHHSLEHMPDQQAAFAGILRVLRPGGLVLIRIPVASSYAWRTYGTDWGHLDAPRHLYLHTKKSLGVLAGSFGFSLVKVVHDSTYRQFTRSIAAQRGIAWNSEQFGRMFSKREKKEFKRLTRELNARGEGDYACFFLRRGEASAARG